MYDSRSHSLLNNRHSTYMAMVQSSGTANAVETLSRKNTKKWLALGESESSLESALFFVTSFKQHSFTTTKTIRNCADKVVFVGTTYLFNGLSTCYVRGKFKDALLLASFILEDYFDEG